MELYAICAEKCLLLERDDADDDLKSEEGDERTLADLEYPTEILRRRSSFKKKISWSLATSAQAENNTNKNANITHKNKHI